MNVLSVKKKIPFLTGHPVYTRINSMSTLFDDQSSADPYLRRIGENRLAKTISQLRTECVYAFIRPKLPSVLQPFEFFSCRFFVRSSSCELWFSADLLTYHPRNPFRSRLLLLFRADLTFFLVKKIMLFKNLTLLLSQHNIIFTKF